MSQIYKPMSGGGGGGVTSVTGIDGITANPTTGNVIVSRTEETAFLDEFDDFISAGKAKLDWQTITGSPNITYIDGTATNPGILQLETVPTSNNAGIYIGQSGDDGQPTIGPFALGDGQLIVNWIVKLGALSAGGNKYVFSCGMADATSLNASTDAFVDGIYFQYTDTVNAGNWTINATASSTTTTANTATAVTTAFTTLSMIVNAGATSVSYYVNGTQVANSPITTNIPTAAITPFFLAVNTSGNTPTFNADLFSIRINLSRPGLSI